MSGFLLLHLHTLWQFIGDLSCPHYWTVNYSSLPGNLKLLNKCLWNKCRNYSLLLFVLLHILQGPAQMSPLLGGFSGFLSVVELIMSSV